MSNLLALAARVEALTGPCRETDAEIAFATGWRLFEGQWWSPVQAAAARKNKRSFWSCGMPAGLSPYTASLDAAMTLVPDECRWSIVKRPGGTAYHATVWWSQHYETVSDMPNAWTATPALALTAAALRARAAA